MINHGVTTMPSEAARTIDLLVARRMRERRRQIGMTQQKLGAIIGVAFQQAHKYERGLSRVSAGRLFQIANALQAPISYFFLEDGALAPDQDAEGRRREAGHEL